MSFVVKWQRSRIIEHDTMNTKLTTVYLVINAFDGTESFAKDRADALFHYEQGSRIIEIHKAETKISPFSFSNHCLTLSWNEEMFNKPAEEI